MESLQQTVLLQVAGAKIKVGILLDFEVVLWKKKKSTHQASFCSFAAFHTDLHTIKGNKAQVGNS